jgi:hypothetical protein
MGVWRQHRDIPVSPERRSLGIGDDRPESPARQCNNVAEQPIAQHPFRIIGEHDNVAFREGLREPPLDLGESFVIERLGRLVVDP